MRVALVNTNRIRPPVAPIGLDYLAEALASRGHSPRLLDLCWEPSPEEAIRRFFGTERFGLVGITVRNTDDCSFTTRESFLPGLGRIASVLRECTDVPVLAGGVGFSVMPEGVLDALGLDAGVRGDGEQVLPAVADRLERGNRWDDLPNLVLREGNRFRRNRDLSPDLGDLPPMSRSWVDNPRYFREGGQAGVETKRGCPRSCIYCADPLAKGRASRLRDPEAVAEEIGALLRQGIDTLHLCDSEFNIPPAHALAVCGEIVRRGLAGKVRWYAYCAPRPFPAEMAERFRRAGCAGINFGADSGDPGMLSRLGRDHGPEDLLAAAGRCRDHGIAVMFDLLFGAPGESAESVERTIDLMRRAAPDLVGVSLGVRVYPGTELASRILRENRSSGLSGGGADDLVHPVFYVDPAIAPDLSGLLEQRVGDDERFLFFDPDRPRRNYNYNANRLLEEAIREGHRGAYWDILRRYRPA